MRPTARQQAALTACLDDHRALYNAALSERREAHKRSQVSIRYGDQSAQLKEIRAYDPDQAHWSFSSQQATLRRLDKAFRAFFDRVKAGRPPGFPRFKGRGWFDTVEWPKDGDGCRWDSPPEHPSATFVRLQGIGHVRVHQHRPVRGRVKTISVKREGSRRYIVLSCDDVPAEKLAAVQQDLARKKRGSKRRRKAVARVAALHGKIRRQRLDGAHKAANALIRDYDMIVHEDLRIANMTKSPAPKPDGEGGYLPNRAAAKAGLNKSILDAGWGVFLGILAHKAESAGRELISVDPRNTSRTCAQCGHMAKENRATQAEFACTACGHTAHADVNAAINILGAGLALREAAAASREAALFRGRRSHETLP
ncbi:transposase [Nonomuraea sp. NPDC048892]|uniref:RNA-guided endonuclease InsQ/TnpB family protein n=2 Tax=unclassified Nonomuraea TaxID=2593643 RepID=UPI0033FB2CF8